MLARWLLIVMEEVGMDAQTGFCPDRSTTYGLFITFVSFRKCKEYGLDTWALFIDLVQAFDTVPRGALFAIFRNFGLPKHFVNTPIS